MIICARPPNFDAILNAFPDAGKPGVIFAYGEHIFSPSGESYVGPALQAHEQTHLVRQQEEGADRWWDQYLTDAEFRYREEVYAHAAEYIQQAPYAVDRNARARLLHSTARRLIAPLYNYQPPRTLSEALRDLQREI